MYIQQVIFSLNEHLKQTPSQKFLTDSPVGEPTWFQHLISVDNWESVTESKDAKSACKKS